MMSLQFVTICPDDFWRDSDFVEVNIKAVDPSDTLYGILKLQQKVFLVNFEGTTVVSG